MEQQPGQQREQLIEDLLEQQQLIKQPGQQLEQQLEEQLKEQPKQQPEQQLEQRMEHLHDRETVLASLLSDPSTPPPVSVLAAACTIKKNMKQPGKGPNDPRAESVGRRPVLPPKRERGPRTQEPRVLDSGQSKRLQSEQHKRL